jgi:RNA polymerase sigma factor (sigma-70 family)
MPHPLQWLFQRTLDDSRLKEHSDEKLLRQFIAGRDRSAFDTLLIRHGPMVLDVCRGMLINEADIEDAFQATFLILARKAASVRKSGSLACWLHGVAYRVARRAQTAFARRQKHEARVSERKPTTADDLTWREIRLVIHEELNRLGTRVREPLILCYLQGMTQDQAAAALRLPKGTLKGRLERGRALLRARLVRRGLGAAGALLASTMPTLATSDLPDALVDTTAQVAMSVANGNSAAALVATRADVLASGVVRSMFITKVKTAAIVLAGCGLLIGWLLLGGTGAPANAPDADKDRPAEEPKAPVDNTRAKLKWQEGPDRIREQTGPVFGLAFSPDGKKLAVAATKRRLNGEVYGEITVFDPATGKELNVISGYHPVVFSDDGKLLAYRYGDGGVAVADGTTFEHKALLKGLSDTVTCLAFRPDGMALAAGSGDPSKNHNPGMVRVWDLENGGERCTHTHPGEVCLVRFSADGKNIISASSGTESVVKTWDVRANREIAKTVGPGGRFFGGVALSPDGKTFATGIDPVGDTSEMDVKIWDFATGKQVGPALHHMEYISGIDFSPDGKTVLIGSNLRKPDETRTGVIRLWDVATGKETATLRAHNGKVNSVTFTRDGKTFASGAWDGSVKLWQLAADPDADDQWLKSEDGVLALHVSAFDKTAKPGESIELVARLKNVSDKPVNVLRPFADAGIEIRGPQGKLGYLGNPRIYKVLPEAFVRLGPTALSAASGVSVVPVAVSQR